MKLNLFKTAAILFVLTFLVNCQRSTSQRNGNNTTPPATLGAIQDGSSSGGGSFGDESSMTILHWAAEDLSRQIRNASPEIFKSLPQGWTQQQLADVIANVYPTKQNRETYQIPEVHRHGQRLMFDYRQDKEGKPYLTATRLFVDGYAHYDVNSRPKHDFFFTIEEVKLKLAHEAAHLMGLGLKKETDMSEARAFAKSLLESLDSDNFECLPTQAPPQQIYTAFETQLRLQSLISQANLDENSSSDERKKVIQDFLQLKTRAYVFNRPTGKAAVPSNIRSQDLLQDQAFCKSPPDGCTVSKDPNAYLNSSSVTVFAPQSYDENFDLISIRNSILNGQREYGFKEGYFSWKLVDLRKAVLTENGYRSHYKYERQNDENNYFAEYQDYQVNQSTNERIELLSYPPLQQEAWNFYRSQGQAKIIIDLKNGEIHSSRLIVLKDFNAWFDGAKTPDISLEVPLTCIRSFKALKMP